ncbi:MAG: sulfotransferase, partial [Chromatiales bacterium]
MASLFHPLCGANLGTLLRLLTDNGPVAVDRLPQAGIALTVTLARLPFSLAEQVRYRHRRSRAAPMPAPLFIVGYWRSGTTHLHNVLSKAERFGHISPLAAGMPWDVLGLVQLFEPWLNRALPEDRYVDRVAVEPDSPQEDSIALASMGAPSYYHGIYFPRHFERHFRRGVYLEGCRPGEIERWRESIVQLLERVFRQQGNRQLLIKNPVYTAQIARLRKIWPQAKFIHIHRNPYVVFRSTRHFFGAMLEELALQDYSLSELPVEALILESYPKLLDALYADAQSLPAGDFVELRFEDFEREPLAALERIFTALG